jgi:hypothetical protein
MNINDAYTPLSNDSMYSYKFENYDLFTAISNPPNIANTKNDFAVWGKRKSISGADVPIHARFAIDTKPTKYTRMAWYDKKTGVLQEPEYEFTIDNYDWREILYRMALDYYRHNEEPDFLIKLEQLNPQFIDGHTGYEQYYSDIQAFWR